MVPADKKLLDPPRYPNLINPIEAEMKRSFDATTKRILVDVAKQIVEEVKKK